ncbi:hypothetical protein N1851_013346 [Merluccius polli]|uniref:Uncharacterized protein n=1 Tax=Merluccius polli TaxID=89951 RepID=A0AA47P1P7_MERPO|nr:hypothetical protein N1851_013346 [Merluccius polli]
MGHPRRAIRQSIPHRQGFREKLDAWPKISSKGSMELQELADFLRCCEAAMSQIRGLEILNDCNENQKILSKLQTGWNRKVIEAEEDTHMFPSFSQFVNERIPDKSVKSGGPGAKVLATTSDEKAVVTSCGLLTQSTKGVTSLCKGTILERIKFVQENKLCFGCLKFATELKIVEKETAATPVREDTQLVFMTIAPRRERMSTRSEQSRYSDKDKEEYKGIGRMNSHKTSQRDHHVRRRHLESSRDVGDTHTSTIIPVWVSSTSVPSREVSCTHSLIHKVSTTFIRDETAKALNARSEPVQLNLSTVASRYTNRVLSEASCLQVRGFYSGQDNHSSSDLLKRVYPCKQRPYSHTRYGESMAALVPRQVVACEEHQPFAQKTDLGWRCSGMMATRVCNYGRSSGISHQVMVKQVMQVYRPLQTSQRKCTNVCRTQIKEVLLPAMSSRCGRVGNQPHLSRRSKVPVNNGKEHQVKEATVIRNPLPFKKERLTYLIREICAIHRLRCLERRLRRNDQYYKDYKTFMDETIRRGDAEKVRRKTSTKLPAWYIPHHGVYHPQKPGKIRVVFDCSAKYQGTSLKRPPPDGSCVDIERHFHQFHVKAEDQDYLRSFGGTRRFSKANFHLSDETSSPGCANYGLKHVAAEGQGNFSDDTIKFIQRNFYVDDGLSSVASEDQAIQLVKEARELCSTGKLRLHKFISNSKKVLDAIPKEECAAAAKDKDMALALGVQWCVASDEFQFRVIVKDPLTRRGVLSTVASVYDPLGFVAPFILLGKQILQQMCRDKLSWDDTLPDDLRSVGKLASRPAKSSRGEDPRCYVPSSFKVQHYELHHFAASESGYGECSYLRAVSTSSESTVPL